MSSEADKKAEQEIRKLHEEWFKASSAQDLDGMMKPIAKDAVSYEHDSPLQYVGADAIREVCKRGIEATEGESKWDMPDLKVIVNGDLAVAYGLNRMQSIVKGEVQGQMWSRGTRVFQKIDGEWKLTHQHVSFPYDAETGKARLDLTPKSK